MAVPTDVFWRCLELLWICLPHPLTIFVLPTESGSERKCSLLMLSFSNISYPSSPGVFYRCEGSPLFDVYCHRLLPFYIV